jgi:DNA-directed RNA polymerase delta subunit
MSVLKGVMQGYADVYEDGKFIGCIERKYGTRHGYRSPGWYAYDQNRKLISEFPSPKREMARDEVNHHYAAQQNFTKSLIPRA